MTASRRWSLILASCLGIAAVGALAHGLASPSATWLGPALTRLPARGGRAEVALTFDDGPSVPFTGQILDILRDTRVRATFFLCGANAERHPDLARRILAEGHVIGNHTYSHPYLTLMSRAKIAGEIERAQAVLQKITGARPALFRPPYGVRWFSLWPLLVERGMTMVLWSGGGHEGRGDPRGIVETTLAELRPGSILLLHDGHETSPPERIDRSATVRALPAIISGARRMGYTFVAIPKAPVLPQASGGVIGKWLGEARNAL